MKNTASARKPYKKNRRKSRVKPVFVILAATATAAIALTVVNIQKIRGSNAAPNKPNNTKIQQEVEYYDNWAVFPEDGEIGGTSVMDERVAVYADKMFGEATREGADFTVISQYDLGVVLAVNGNNANNADRDGWFARNSWRFGFVEQTSEGGSSINFRYVGVFAAEQMYYSGMTLQEYRQSQN